MLFLQQGVFTDAVRTVKMYNQHMTSADIICCVSQCLVCLTFFASRANQLEAHAVKDN